jgi:effector-binding domain-containing protein
MNQVSVVEVPSQTVIGIRKPGKYSRIGELLGQLVQVAMSSGIQLAGMPVFIMHEVGTEEAERADREGNADIDVAFPVARAAKTTGEVTCYELPGGTMAKIVHKGPYETCGASYAALFQWIQANGKRITGPTREVYLNDPREVPPEQILTEIYAPIA